MKCVMVIFGGTGDLSHKKLYPAIFRLYQKGQLPRHFALVSIGRRKKDVHQFRDEAADSIRNYTKADRKEENKISDLVARFYYYETDFYDIEGYRKLKVFLSKLDADHRTEGNRIFYLAVAPEHFAPIVDRIDYAKLAPNQGKSWQKLIIEKPFGKDLCSARILNKSITKVFDEEYLYRIDHYLGKEMLQNIMVIRFANALFEPLWNNKYISHIQITSSETVGVENRGGYYENAGALRDMVQNHMLQLLMLTAMEPPISLDTHAIRDEKVRVLKALSPMTEKNISQDVIRGQYGKGTIDGNEAIAYREEERVAIDSNTETYVAMKVQIENFRWAGVPFYLRTGKRMPQKLTEIYVQFIPLPQILYFKEFQGLNPNSLIIQIQPQEKILLQFNAKRPGTRDEIIPVSMDFCQNCAAEDISPDAYERLIYDVMRGDSTLFTGWDEVEYSWRFIDHIADYWKRFTPNFPNYRAGTWGPEEANDLLRKDKREWRCP